MYMFLSELNKEVGGEEYKEYRFMTSVEQEEHHTGMRPTYDTINVSAVSKKYNVTSSMYTVKFENNIYSVSVKNTSMVEVDMTVYKAILKVIELLNYRIADDYFSRIDEGDFKNIDFNSLLNMSKLARITIGEKDEGHYTVEYEVVRNREGSVGAAGIETICKKEIYNYLYNLVIPHVVVSVDNDIDDRVLVSMAKVVSGSANEDIFDMDFAGFYARSLV